MFNAYQAPYPMPQGNAFQRPAFQQPMMYPQQMLQETLPQVRFVASHEEAVAASVMPGIPCYLVDRAHGMLYYKFIDPQTGMPEMENYARVQQQAPQYATVDALEAFRQEIEQTLEQRFATLSAPKSTPRKAVNSNDE